MYNSTYIDHLFFHRNVISLSTFLLSFLLFPQFFYFWYTIAFISIILVYIGIANYPYATEYFVQTSITVSLGIVTLPEDGVNASELLKRADWCMYTAKSSGKNRICTFHECAASYHNQKKEFTD